MFALIDCNNFFVSCERLFRPDLSTQPVVVLSNNDGCVISRSNEAKALGIVMGAPYFSVKGFCKQHDIRVFSSNYTLYGDISYRVMCVIDESWPHVEIYSIDEAFLDLSSMAIGMRETFCCALQKRILKETGIPVSIGIGKTKTLAKAANYVAKKMLKIPVFDITEQLIWLQRMDVGSVWGVGRRWNKKLLQQGIFTAADLANASPAFLKDSFNVVLMRTAKELSGTRCAHLDTSEDKQSIMSSRSFGVLQTDYKYLAEAVSMHCSHVYKKLRAQQQVTQHLTVFIQSNRFRKDLLQYSNAIDFRLVRATDDLCYLTQVATFCLRKIYKNGVHYQKVGVLISDFSDKFTQQMDLFHQPAEAELAKTERRMGCLDEINKKFGRNSLFLAAEGCRKTWAMKQNLKSPNYTTQWREIPVAY
jgi:DNA polymerase V